MQTNEPTPTTKPKPAPRTSVLRYVLPLVLLVAVIGGVAWVAQYLPSFVKKRNPPPPPEFKALLTFPRYIAQWNAQAVVENNDDPMKKENYVEREVEPGEEGHYDFPFKNIAGKDVEMTHYLSTCDCTSVRACAIPLAEFDKLVEQQKKNPGESLTYSAEPTWLDLQNDRQHSSDPNLKHILTVKAGEAGVVRLRWTVKKALGQTLKVSPQIFFRPADAPDMQWQGLAVPVRVGAPLRFTPARINVGLLAPGAKPFKAELDAWSSTREKFDLKLSTLPASPFYEIETRPLSTKDCADLEGIVKSQHPGTRVKSAYHVTITVYESRDGKQLDQGPFFQKLAVELDKFHQPDLAGPEIVGRVQGDVQIGGAEDQGKIMFKTFAAGEAAKKTVELLADAKVKLETHTHEPSYLEVKVSHNQEQPDPKKHRWTLQVTVPANTPGVRSFEESDHVTLRIVGTPDRFVRIAIEGHVSGR